MGILQDFLRYEMEIVSNIGHGNLAKLNDAYSLQTAAAWSGADELIDKLPNGFEQIVGKRFEGALTCRVANGRNWLWPVAI